VVDTTCLGSWGLAHPMSLTELALPDGRRPLPLGDVIGLTLTLTLFMISSNKLTSSPLTKNVLHKLLHNTASYPVR
jgi:hypothetical protein